MIVEKKKKPKPAPEPITEAYIPSMYGDDADEEQNLEPQNAIALNFVGGTHSKIRIGTETIIVPSMDYILHLEQKVTTQEQRIHKLEVDMRRLQQHDRDHQKAIKNTQRDIKSISTSRDF